MKTDEVIELLRKLSRDIDAVLMKTQTEYGDSNIEYGNTPDEHMLNDEITSIFYNLVTAKDDIDYILTPIKYESIIRKNMRGRYECEYKEYTSGSLIEVLVYDEFYYDMKWVISTIEYKDDDYYLVGMPKANLDGARVRIR